jgi:hypothetical protein
MSSVRHSRRRTLITGSFLAIVTLWITAATSLFAQTRKVIPVPAAESGRRLALVIGNRDYTRRPLSNPVNDASDLADSLNAIGFETKLVTNVDRLAFERAVRDFANEVRPGDVALFYFSGHGMGVDGQNYLLPVDFDAQSATEVKYQAQPASLIQELLQENGARVIILILDACRDNPYRNWKGSGGGGLTAMSGKGVYVAFAAAPGRTADDNPRERNGRFTKFLLQSIGKAGLSIDDVFNEIRAGVSEETGGAQVPFSESGLIGRFVFRPASMNPAPVAEASMSPVPVAKPAIDAGMNVPRVPSPQTLKRPDYCPLPERIDFDSNSEYRDKLGIWTGTWEKNGTRFCIVLTSIRNGKVHGLMSSVASGIPNLLAGTAKSSSSSLKIDVKVVNQAQVGGRRGGADPEVSLSLESGGSGDAWWKSKQGNYASVKKFFSPW